VDFNDNIGNSICLLLRHISFFVVTPLVLISFDMLAIILQRDALPFLLFVFLFLLLASRMFSVGLPSPFCLLAFFDVSKPSKYLLQYIDSILIFYFSKFLFCHNDAMIISVFYLSCFYLLSPFFRYRYLQLFMATIMLPAI